MDRMEMVEKIREKADITMEEARELLEKNSWDMLDACVELEQTGRMRGMAQASTERKTTEEYEQVNPTVTGKSYEGGEAERKERTVNKFREGVRSLLRMSIDNKFLVKKGDDSLIRVPVLPLVLLLIAKFWLTVGVLFVGLVLGFRYSFEGEQLGKVDINQTIDKAADAASELVGNFTDKK